MQKPLRGQVWFVNLNPTMGREQAKKRPCLVLSSDIFNQGPAELAVVIPLTSRERSIPLHIPVYPPSGGLVVTSYLMCEQIRAVSIKRFAHHLGQVNPNTLKAVEYALKTLLEFS